MISCTADKTLWWCLSIRRTGIWNTKEVTLELAKLFMNDAALLKIAGGISGA
jgi:hypothetical protein